MKKIILFFAVLFTATMLLAQAPSSFKYQAVARNGAGAVLVNQNVSFRISILQGTVTGVIVYAERHLAQTNEFGLVTLEIGNGTVVKGTMEGIEWGLDSYFLKVEMDPSGGDAFQFLGTSQLLSVPYALHARSVETGDNWGTQEVISDASLSGKGTVSSPIGLSQNGASTGQVLKYSGSTWIPSDDKAGGLMLPYTDSATVGSKETVWKITCYGDTWSSAITGISKSSNGTGVVGEGAFGVVGSATVPGGTGMRGVNPSTTGSGWGLSGVANSSGSGGIWGSGGLYGVKADAGSPSGYGIYGTASSSTGITYAVYGRVYSPEGYAGYFKGGKFHVSGRVGIGTESPSAGLHLKGNGYPESFIYLEANTGQDAGFRLYEGSLAKWHIFNNSGAGGLQIYNNAGQTAIFAKQSNSHVGINTTEPTQSLDVNGVARIRGMMTGVVATTVYRTSDGTLITGASDSRLKDNIEPLQNGLEKVMKLQGVTFTWKADLENRKSIGFIAQEFEKVIPELVFTNEADGYKGINYAEVSAVLVEAIKELKAENDRLKSENGLNQTKIESLEGRLSKLERSAGD